jgi:hypothetical protein
MYCRHLSQSTAEVPEFRDQVHEYYVVLPTHFLQDQWERGGPSTTQHRSALPESLIPRGLTFVVRHNNDMPLTFRKLGRFRRIAILLEPLLRNIFSSSFCEDIYRRKAFSSVKLFGTCEISSKQFTTGKVRNQQVDLFASLALSRR